MPRKIIVERVTRCVGALPGWPRLRILDLSCGDGDLLEALSRAGGRPEGTHFRPDDYIFADPARALQTATIHRDVDLTKPLPFPDATYDVLLATEVIEHLSSCISLFAEIGRILKPGGHFIFSTPNIHRLQSRLRFLLTGQHELRGARLGWETAPGDLYSTHHNPAYFPVLHTRLHHHGFHIQRLVFTECNPFAFLLAPLYPVIAFATALEARHAIRRSAAGGKDLCRRLLHPAMLCSDQLLVVAHKPAAGGDPRA